MICPSGAADGAAGLHSRGSGRGNPPHPADPPDPRIAAELVDAAGGHGLAGDARGRGDRVAEVADFHRYANALQLIAYLGLSEHSSGAITKAGNMLARRVLIEGAWTYRMLARIGRKLHDRNAELPPIIRDIAWKAQLRLCARSADSQLPERRRLLSLPRSCARSSPSSGQSRGSRNQHSPVSPNRKGCAPPPETGPREVCGSLFQLHRPGGSGLGGSSATTDSLYLRMQP